MDIVKRIEKLKKDLIEEDEGGEINKSSLKDFANFNELVDDFIGESLVISLTPDNNIYASWLLGKDRYSFHFKGNGDISFVVMKGEK